MSRVRPADGLRLALGAVALLRPGTLLRLTRTDSGAGTRAVTRVLGVRYLAQAGGGLAVEDRWVPEIDAAVDLVHAASMVGFAIGMPRHRRLAVFSGVAAVGFATLDLRQRPTLR